MLIYKIRPASSFSGFKNHLRLIQTLEHDISQFSREFFPEDNYLDFYIEGMKILKLHGIFLGLLTDREKDAIQFLRYHRRKSKIPEEYSKNVDSAYEKYKKVFFSPIHKYIRKIDLSILGKELEFYRITNDVSVAKLARAIDVDRSTISRLEKGKSMPSLEYIVKFCQYFKCSMDKVVMNSLDSTPYLGLSEVSYKKFP